MKKSKLVYIDDYGNKLFKRYVKSRDSVQWSAKNVQGKLVDRSGVETMLKRAKKAGALGRIPKIEREIKWGKH